MAHQILEDSIGNWWQFVSSRRCEITGRKFELCEGAAFQSQIGLEWERRKVIFVKIHRMKVNVLETQ